MPPNPPVDMTDDWMNPPLHSSSSFIYKSPTKDDPMEYLIERQRRLITFGDPLYRWDYWAKYDTAEARDAALARLREEHPVWHLRGRDRHPYWEQFGMDKLGH